MSAYGTAYGNFMELQLAAILDDVEALAAIDKIAAELGPHATDAQREVVWQRMLKEKDTKPHPLFGGGASLLAKRPFLKQLKLPLKQPASPVVADLAAIEETSRHWHSSGSGHSKTPSPTGRWCEM